MGTFLGEASESVRACMAVDAATALSPHHSIPFSVLLFPDEIGSTLPPRLTLKLLPAPLPPTRLQLLQKRGGMPAPMHEGVAGPVRVF